MFLGCETTWVWAGSVDVAEHCSVKCAKRQGDRFDAAVRNYMTSTPRGFSISKEQVKELILQPCHYCGVSHSKTISPQAKDQSYEVNGIDRIDSSRGYEDGNVVPCCKTCNFAKRDTSYDEFLDWLDRLVKHRGKDE